MKGTAIAETKTTGQSLFRGKPVRRMHVMVKPTGALCNLDCTYCYYLSKQELLTHCSNTLKWGFFQHTLLRWSLTEIA